QGEQPSSGGTESAAFRACIAASLGEAIADAIQMMEDGRVRFSGDFDPRNLTQEQQNAIGACLGGQAPSDSPSGGGPGPTPTPATSTGDPGTASQVRQLSEQEKAALQTVANSVRASSVVVGEMVDGDFRAGGSGFVYTSDGLIMTNAHVLASIKGAAAVMLYDGRVLPANIVGFIESQQPDVGVLRISASGLALAQIGDSNTVRPGDPLLLVAHPRGHGYWLATGGQAYGQQDVGAGGVFITTLYSNVPGGPGASGGPMVDGAGRVVGLLYAGTGSSDPPVQPSPAVIIRDPRHWSSIAERPVTTAVAINDAMGAAQAIVAAGGNVPSWSRSAKVPSYQIQGAQVQLLTDVDVPNLPPDQAATLNQALQIVSPNHTALSVQRNSQGYLLTFNAPPTPDVINMVVLPLFTVRENLPTELVGTIPQSVVETQPVPDAPARDAALLEILRTLLPGVVHISVRGGASRGTGTGSIISADGYILTNAHVIDDEGTFEVTLHDDRRFPAQRIGYVNGRTPDVGVLKIQAAGLQPATIGDASALQGGEEILLIGHPAERRFWRISAGDFLQSVSEAGTTYSWTSLWIANTSFTGGNSGGPLVNVRGEVVGLFHGSPPLNVAPIEASPPEVIWGWHTFDQLFGFGDEKMKIGASVAISDAMARAQEIIQKQGNLP
ncbi:MAG: trypsin-like serine protease, partial [SAR202 cluster bacterium]|nr:trypsin-like serine protease [SAR202 cluster bacterium]